MPENLLKTKAKDYVGKPGHLTASCDPGTKNKAPTKYQTAYLTKSMALLTVEIRLYFVAK